MHVAVGRVEPQVAGARPSDRGAVLRLRRRVTRDPDAVHPVVERRQARAVETRTRTSRPTGREGRRNSFAVRTRLARVGGRAGSPARVHGDGTPGQSARLSAGRRDAHEPGRRPDDGQLGAEADAHEPFRARGVRAEPGQARHDGRVPVRSSRRLAGELTARDPARVAVLVLRGRLRRDRDPGPARRAAPVSSSTTTRSPSRTWVSVRPPSARRCAVVMSSSHRSIRAGFFRAGASTRARARRVSATGWPRDTEAHARCPDAASAAPVELSAGRSADRRARSGWRQVARADGDGAAQPSAAAPR